jgi:two-component sensor histidine kinase
MTTTRKASPVLAFASSLLKGWLVSALVFGLVAVIMVGQFTLAVSLPWADALRMAGRDWLPWAILAPLIFQLVNRLPLERERWKLALPAHLLCGVAAVAFCNWWSDSVIPSRYSWRGGPSRSGESRDRRPPPPPRAPSPGLPESRSPAGERSGPPRSSRWRGPDRDSPFRFFFLFGFRFPIYLAIVSVAHALYFYRRSKERERRSLELQASLARARLEALKMQLQPHFLFNAMNAIAALVHKDPEAADEMLAALSDFLRLVLATSGEQELPLQRELELVERYLAIEHARFGDRLSYQVDVPAELQPALVPAFLLQPLVENAVRHGLEPRPGAGSVSIRARRDNGHLHLEVADDGVGLPDQLPAREGIGLVNTRARLRELYQGNAQMELRSGQGVTVEITLPYHAAHAAA